MEEEEKKQYKLIQSGERYRSSRAMWTLKCACVTSCERSFRCGGNAVNWQISPIPTEIASAQVKVVSDSPKKCIYHRRAGVNPQTSATEEALQQPEVQTSQTQEDTSAFVFTPSKEEFRFNFLWFVLRRHIFVTLCRTVPGLFGLRCVLDVLCDRTDKKHMNQVATLEMMGEKHHLQSQC